ncbi:MAG: hypothetical protein PHR26_02265 [Candidatus ainarchaeum sp.]|nr:hypothetical protein [Candidatus ainarchaeum sp.]MDD3975925.1 hypothetical protein [Candidatus ainarchaeum sp.]
MDKKKFLKINTFILKNEYQLLTLSGFLSGLLILFITNKFFFKSELYYLLFFFGIIVSFFGFVLEYFIKKYKTKSLEKVFSYFLSDLSRDYKKTKNLSLSLINISNSNVYKGIDNDIKKISNRVSWGDSFENSLKCLNFSLDSDILNHTLILFNNLKNTSLSLDQIFLKISKDINLFREDKQKKRYFSHLFNLSIVFFIVFIFVLLYLDILIGSNFLWYNYLDSMNRIFFDNFILYIAIVLSFFTAFVISTIKDNKFGGYLKYIGIFFIIIIILFQIVIPKPEAQEVLISTINYMNLEDIDYFYLENIISIQSLSSKYISENTTVDRVYFKPLDVNLCKDTSCLEYTILIKDASFFNFELIKVDKNIIILYEYNY